MKVGELTREHLGREVLLHCRVSEDQPGTLGGIYWTNAPNSKAIDPDIEYHALMILDHDENRYIWCQVDLDQDIEVAS